MTEAEAMSEYIRRRKVILDEARRTGGRRGWEEAVGRLNYPNGYYEKTYIIVHEGEDY